MKNIFILLLTVLSVNVFAQESEKIHVPKGVVYKYCDSATLEKAKILIRQNLTENPNYELSGKITFIGPVLWNRFQKIKALKKIEGGNVTFLVDNNTLSGKMTQNVDDSKKVWDELRKEVQGKEFKLRKATFKELQYYWSVISFDIEEPLIIIETKEHNYILNLSPKDLKMIWMDEAPVKN